MEHHGGNHMKAMLHFCYDFDFYYEQPEFPEFYSKIKRFLTMEDTICIGFSVGNDVNYIINSCNRYKLNTINYDSYDIQIMANKYLESSTDVSLKDACSKIVGTQAYVQAQEHLAKDDAKMTMKVYEALCMFWKTDSMSLLKEYQLNSKRPDFKPKEINYVFLTHAHIDHCGRVGQLYK